MDMSKKRDLMIAVETLCVRPGNADAKTINDALAGFQELIKYVTANQINVVYTMGDKP
ncbi:hypothetical protein MTX11_09945 [Acinetobacter lwoffii]|jgi:hypothetical protein|uniref:hypothetical protein n=1 Tax=Acinetobacter lwoffii TaxID=28090 RepID=UPI001FB4D21C|nr:hypothetical protein [Acinetobacter lwoffii]MCJ0928296.1 hypothetical protein [Acinetobacter lwoffii]